MPPLLEYLIFSDDSAGWLALLGVGIGLIFGFSAHRSAFCLRAAALEAWRRERGQRLYVWLTALGTAVLLTQLGVQTGWIDTANVNKLSNPTSLSAAALGGLLFGVGMALSRGCVSRLLVLSGTGNTRAILTLVIVAVVVQTSLTGSLAPLRLEIRDWWTLPPQWSTFLNVLPPTSGVTLGGGLLLVALTQAYRQQLPLTQIAAAMVVGAAPPLAWLVTTQFAAHSFDIVPAEGISFAGPAGEQLTKLMTDTNPAFDFSGGLLVGVLMGALLSSLLSRRFAWQYFDATSGTVRYVIGAVLMGFGATLVTGCSVGAGLTDGSMLLNSAWLALLFMWLGVGIADRLWDREPALLVQSSAN